MRKILFFLGFSGILITLMYGILSGGLSKSKKKEIQGQRLLVQLKKRYSDLTVQGKFKYFDIDILLIGDIDEHREFLISEKYKEVSPLLFCKLGNEVSINILSKNKVIMKYRYDSKKCQKSID